MRFDADKDTFATADTVRAHHGRHRSNPPPSDTFRVGRFSLYVEEHREVGLNYEVLARTFV